MNAHPSSSTPVHGSAPSLNHKSIERLNRSLTIETSPRSLDSDCEICTRILHPDGSVSTLDHVPEGTIKLSRNLPEDYFETHPLLIASFYCWQLDDYTEKRAPLLVRSGIPIGNYRTEEDFSKAYLNYV